MRTLLALVCLFGGIASAQTPKQMDAPAYQLGPNTLFDASKGSLLLPGNSNQLYTLPSSCTFGQIQATYNGLFACGLSGWYQLATLTNGAVSSGQLPNISTLPGTLLAGQLPSPINANTTGNAATATALASAPSAAQTGQYCTAVDVHGNCVSAQVQWSQIGSAPNFALSSSLSAVALSGSYNDLINKPSLSFDASGAAAAVQSASLQKTSNLSDLSSASTARTNLGLASVAASGSYNDLTNKPTIPSAYTLTAATANALGSIKCGSNTTCAGDGTLSVAAPYSLPAATSSAIGGVIINGNHLTIANGILSVTGSDFDASGAAPLRKAPVSRNRPICPIYRVLRRRERIWG